MEGKILECKSYTKVGSEMTWPSYHQGELEWRLRYGTAEQMYNDRLLLASIVASYKQLIDVTQKHRNAVCKALKDAE